MDGLFEKLREYGKSGAYPFHMPGHKRQKNGISDPYEIDITEIDGFDNLHHAEGVLLEAQQRAAGLYASEETHFLVNGSTAGILSAVSACAKKTILMARNCHKAAYHGALLGKLDVHYLYPDVQQEFFLNGGICPWQVEQQICRHPEIEAVLITSPTFDGMVSDVGRIADICHKYGKPLIVDEAHGAHFGFSEYFPQNSVGLGADIVIHSLHKTLPSFTQTALLHVNGELVDRERLRFFLQIFQTSSPSYVLMAGIDRCIRYVEEKGKEAFSDFAARLEKFYFEAQELQQIQLVNKSVAGSSSIWDFDRSKLIFSVKNCQIAGNRLQEIMRKEYGLELEMAAGSYALALTSVCDTDDGFSRLLEAVKEIDRRLCVQKSVPPDFPVTDTVTKNEIFCTIDRAYASKKKQVLWKDSEGLVSGEFLYLYPPGIPLLVPGERIGSELLLRMTGYRKKNFRFQGLSDYEGKTIQVLDV